MFDLVFGFREAPDMSGMEITEQSAWEAAKTIRTWVEEGIRWMFKVAAEGDLFTFAGTVGGLWMVSQIGNIFDLLTLLYVGNDIPFLAALLPSARPVFEARVHPWLICHCSMKQLELYIYLRHPLHCRDCCRHDSASYI